MPNGGRTARIRGGPTMPSKPIGQPADQSTPDAQFVMFRHGDRRLRRVVVAVENAWVALVVWCLLDVVGAIPLFSITERGGGSARPGHPYVTAGIGVLLFGAISWFLMRAVLGYI